MRHRPKEDNPTKVAAWQEIVKSRVLGSEKVEFKRQRPKKVET